MDFTLLLVILYFVPSLIAAARRVPNIGSVVVINLFLGLSVIGWVVALAMAARSVPTTRSESWASYRLH